MPGKLANCLLNAWIYKKCSLLASTGISFPAYLQVVFHLLQPFFAQYQTICKFVGVLVQLNSCFATIVLITVNCMSVIIHAN